MEDNIMEERRLYTKEEDDYIMDNWTLKTHKEIAETLNRSTISVINRHKKLVIRANKEDEPQQQEGSNVIVTVAKVLTGANGLPVCHVLSIDNYNVLDYFKQEYDKRRLPMVGVISKFVYNVIHSENAIAFCDEIADALIYSGETYEGAIKHCLDCVFTENELDLLCEKVAEKIRNNTLNRDIVGYYDMLKILRSDPVAALTSGKLDERFIGVMVTLPNSAITCQEWMIADVNHDGTSGTVDLFSKTTLTNGTIIQFSTSSQIYKNSNLDNYLESTVYNGFATEVKNALNLMDVESNRETIQRHIVAPSLTEVGNSYPNDVIQEGAIYPIFSPACNPNPKSIFIRPNGNGVAYWTRSRYTNFSRGVWRVGSGGDAYSDYYDGSTYVVARIRFAAK